MAWLDPALLEKIEWIPVDTTVCIAGSTPSASLLAARFQSSIDRTNRKLRSNLAMTTLRNSALLGLMSFEISALKPIDSSRPKHVLFVTNTVEDRHIPEEHKQYLMDLISKTLRAGKTLKVYNGLNEKKELLGYQENFDLFRYASVVIGPHGTY